MRQCTSFILGLTLVFTNLLIITAYAYAENPQEVKFTGKTDAPSKAYAEWAKALMDGDIDS